jgi:hypothetical protein
VFLPALVGLPVPEEMVKAIAAFLDLCYIVRQPSLSEADLKALDDALERFCMHRTIFITSGICPKGISLPRQHSLQHYHRHIVQFGAPDGLSTSITESKHIDAVKKPWRRTNHFEELGQILFINQRMDKLAAFHSRLFERGLLDAPLVPEGTEVREMESDAGNEDFKWEPEDSEMQEIVLIVEEEEYDDDDDDDDDDVEDDDVDVEDDDDDVDEGTSDGNDVEVDTKKVDSVVILPQKPGKHYSLLD